MLPALVKANTLPPRIGSMASPPHSPLPPPELAASTQTIPPLPSSPLLADSNHSTQSPPPPPPHRRNPQLTRSTGDVSRSTSDRREGSRHHHSHKRPIHIGHSSGNTENIGLGDNHHRPTWRRYNYHRLSIPTLSNDFYQQQQQQQQKQQPHPHSKSYSK